MQQRIKILEMKYTSDMNQVKAKSLKDDQDKNKELQMQGKLLAMNQVKDEKIEYLENHVRSIQDRLSTERRVH